MSEDRSKQHAASRFLALLRDQEAVTGNHDIQAAVEALAQRSNRAKPRRLPKPPDGRAYPDRREYPESREYPENREYPERLPYPAGPGLPATREYPGEHLYPTGVPTVDKKKTHRRRSKGPRSHR